MSVEQRINLKFLVRLRKTPAEALKLLQEVYGDDTMSRTRLFECHKRFKREERRWKMITGVGSHPQVQQVKMLSVLDKRCKAIAVLL